jgi:hypothetical protein
VHVVCAAPDSEEALQILTALIDAATAAIADAAPSPVSPVEGPENERRQLLVAIQRQERSIAALTQQLATAKVAANGAFTTDDDLAALELERIEARRAIAEAERQLDDARRDFDARLAPEVVVARLPEGPNRTNLLDRLGEARLKDELRQQEVLAEKLSAVYGRNHPRMSEIKGRIGELRKQIRPLTSPSDGQTSPESDADPHRLVLDALEWDLEDARVSAQQVEARLLASHDRSGTRKELESQLAEARQELAFLHEEYDRARRETAGAPVEQHSRSPVVLGPPALSSEPLTSFAGLPIAASCVAGMAVYMFILWQLRNRGNESDASPDSRPMAAPFARAPLQRNEPRGALAPPLVQIPLEAEHPTASDGRRTPDELRLARLKMLSTRGSVPVKW